MAGKQGKKSRIQGAAAHHRGSGSRQRTAWAGPNPWRQPPPPLHPLHRRRDAFGLALLFLAVLALFAASAGRTVMLEDDGLFITAAYTAGVAHPPGYPLYVLLGWLGTHLPIGSIAWRVHALSGVMGALTCLCVAWLVLRRTGCRPAAYLATAALAVSTHFWSQAIIADVYTTNTALLFLTVVVAWEAVMRSRGGGAVWGDGRGGSAMAVAAGGRGAGASAGTAFGRAGGEASAGVTAGCAGCKASAGVTAGRAGGEASAGVTAGRAGGEASAGVTAGRAGGEASAGVTAGCAGGEASAGVTAGRAGGEASAGVTAGRATGPVRPGATALWLIAAVLYGLALANHWPLLILGSPIFLAVVLGAGRDFWRRLPILIPLTFAVAGVFYAWMMWRSHQGPAINFIGPINNLNELVAYIRRDIFAAADSKITAGLHDKLLYVRYVFTELLLQFTVAGGALALWGAWRRYRSGWRPGIAAEAAALVCSSLLLVAMLGFDYEYFRISVFRPYLLVAYCILALWLGDGLHGLLTAAGRRDDEAARGVAGKGREAADDVTMAAGGMATGGGTAGQGNDPAAGDHPATGGAITRSNDPPPSRRRDIITTGRLAGWRRLVIITVAAATLIALGCWNSRINYRPHDTFAAELGQMLLDSVEPNAVLVPSGDAYVFSTTYLHLVEGKRPDIRLLEPKGYLFNDRVVQVHWNAKQRDDTWRRFFTGNDRPGYYQSLGPVLFKTLGQQNLGFVSKVDKKIRPGKIGIQTSDAAKVWFLKMLAMPDAPDQWITHSRDSAIRSYGAYLGYVQSMDYPRYTEHIADTLPLAQENYYALVGMAQTMLLQGPAQIETAGAYIAAAKARADPKRSKNAAAKLFYLEGQQHRKQGRRDQAAALYRQSLRINPASTNHAHKALREMFSGT